MKLRDKNWKNKSIYADRVEDTTPHDLIIEELNKYPQSQKAELDDDYKGIDVWMGGIPFDVKVTNGIPKSYKGKSRGINLFRWLLIKQDLDRFHDTNRIIIIIYGGKNQIQKTDAETIAQYINLLSYENYYHKVRYTLKGRPNQELHTKYGESHVMDIGLLIHYKKQTCKMYPT